MIYWKKFFNVVNQIWSLFLPEGSPPNVRAFDRLMGQVEDHVERLRELNLKRLNSFSWILDTESKPRWKLFSEKSAQSSRNSEHFPTVFLGHSLNESHSGDVRDLNFKPHTLYQFRTLSHRFACRISLHISVFISSSSYLPPHILFIFAFLNGHCLSIQCLIEATTDRYRNGFLVQINPFRCSSLIEHRSFVLVNVSSNGTPNGIPNGIQDAKTLELQAPSWGAQLRCPSICSANFVHRFAGWRGTSISRPKKHRDWAGWRVISNRLLRFACLKSSIFDLFAISIGGFSSDFHWRTITARNVQTAGNDFDCHLIDCHPVIL